MTVWLYNLNFWPLQLFETYLQFVGIAITNAQIIEDSRAEYDRNRVRINEIFSRLAGEVVTVLKKKKNWRRVYCFDDVFVQNLLEVVHDLFEEQTSIDKVIMKIMQRAQRLLKCERAAVLLVDEACDSTRFSRLFDLNSPKHTKTNNVKKFDQAPTVGNGLINLACYDSSRQKVEGENVSRYLESLAERVACSGEVLNINENECTDGIVDSGINSLLAMPIRNKNDQIIGK